MLYAMLKIVGGKRDGETISLITPKFLIGREQDCHLRPNSELVSRHHCVFTLDEYSLRLRDLGSTNGTFVNDQRLEGETTLKEGDCVRVGKLDFEIILTADTVEEQPAETAPSEESAQAVPSDTAELSAEETAYELPVGPSVPAGDTAVISPQQLPPQQPIPQSDPAIQQPGYYPQQPVPYPQQPMAYPQQPNMYPQQPMAYPQQPGTYPQPAGVPQQPLDAALPEVILPDPATTGAKDEPPKKTDEQSNESAENQTVDPSEHAAKLIKQHYRRGN